MSTDLEQVRGYLEASVEMSRHPKAKKLLDIIDTHLKEDAERNSEHEARIQELEDELARLREFAGAQQALADERFHELARLREALRIIAEDAPPSERVDIARNALKETT